jgi:hypothetical protein
MKIIQTQGLTQDEQDELRKHFEKNETKGNPKALIIPQELYTVKQVGRDTWHLTKPKTLIQKIMRK